ncbi:MAG TPA: exodeoxyribonuclease III [Acetobacteraceae bacterium]|jgi:exodeoxyribonuclease III|nr:exodeoxyribonuclease III [Acetobacteraceae bacterium]
MKAGKRSRLRIATWNINSLRLRQDRLGALVDALEPDILCLQETKVPDELFPELLPASVGLPHFARRGMKSYNGVAILSRIPFETIAESPDWCGKRDCRHLAVRLDLPGGPVELHNFYVPAGGDVPDPEKNPKFAHKLAFVAEAHEHFSGMPSLSRVVVVGDLNIAPLENDVWSHRQLLDVVSHTPVETEALTAWRETGFTDAVRHFVPEEEKLFTWWSYRNRDWRASDRGRRLDHIWVSDDLAGTLARQTVLADARDWERASDHVPVCVEMRV